MTLGQDNPVISIGAVCRHLGYSRQAYYKRRKARVKRPVDHEALRRLVLRVRATEPHMAGRKLLQTLRAEMTQQGINVGRDRFYAFLKAENLLLSWPRRTVRQVEG